MGAAIHAGPDEAKPGDPPTSARGALCFMETQFPVSKMSVESYKERTAKQGQTLTGLGKWWGRKPLVLCRATILGLLLPATDDPKKDRDVFLRLMTMDEDGLLRRWRKRYTVAELGGLAKPAEHAEWERRDSALEETKEELKRLRLALKGVPRTETARREEAKAAIDANVAEVERFAKALNEFVAELQRAVFLRQPYELKIDRCDRPEQVDGPSPESWTVINAHLGTGAKSLPELVAELGTKRFGHTPRVGDAFCGGGSIPFEAARLGCDAYASDLNPVAAMLTWAALNIVGGGEAVAAEVQRAQREVYDAVDAQITAWGIEHREPDPETGRRWRADAYLYCVEATCPECGWRVLYEISTRTRSMLLATATPVQLRPVEAWDLLDALSRGSEAVLGGAWSQWRKVEEALALVMGDEPLPDDDLEMWQWLRTPLPPRAEHRDFEIIRRSLGMGDETVSANGSDWERLKAPDKARVRQLFPRFVSQHNPFIRHIVRRSRKYLEETRDPQTGEPYLKPIKVELLGERDGDAIRLPLYLQEAYELAEEFCKKLGSRMKGSGFLRTLLLRRVGSSMAAGRITAEKMLGSWQDIEPVADETEGNDEEDLPADGMSRTLTPEERTLLERFVKALEANHERDPKYAVALACLKKERWLERGCIIFSQYFDSVNWLAQQLMADLEGERIAIYAGSGRSGIWHEGRFTPVAREDIKLQVRRGELRLLLGTDAASEGLNLQRLGTLINLDLPWNPTRLEQRKGRIQRIGQLSDTVSVYNMRYLGSVEDRVHQLLSSRLQGIYTLFGQVPDVLADVWIDVALGAVERAKQIIASIPNKHPFDIKYERIEKIDWETCEQVLSAEAKRAALTRGW